MKIKWFDASSFLITSDEGIRVIIDPYQHNYRPEILLEDMDEDMDWLRPAITEPADVVAMTHGHFDHSYVYTIPGIPQLYKGPADVEIKGIKFRGVIAPHGDYRGNVTLINMVVDGISIWHLGDLGRKLSERHLSHVGPVDILLTPWDNDPITMTFDVLTDVLDQLRPKIIFPMHHICLDDYIYTRGNVNRMDVSEVELNATTLPTETQIFLLKPALSFE